MHFPTTAVFLLVFLKPFSCSVFDLRAVKEKNRILFEKNSPVVIQGGSEEFRAVGAKREEEPKPAKPESSIQPFDNVRIINPVIPPKRARSTSSAFILNPTLTAAEIIEQEARMCGYFKVEKRQAFRQALETISANDIDKFMAEKQELLEIFKISQLFRLEKAGMKDFLVKYMILFGADKFFQKFGEDHYDVEVETDVFKYLIATKPLDTIINVLLGFKQVKYTKEQSQEITQMIYAKYPEMEYFRKLAVGMFKPNNNYKWNGKLLTAQSELEAFKLVGSEFNQCHGSYELLSRVPFEKPDLYLQCTPDEKINFIRFIIYLDDLQKFEEILQLDPEMVNHTYVYGYYADIEGSRHTMMDRCTMEQTSVSPVY